MYVRIYLPPAYISKMLKIFYHFFPNDSDPKKKKNKLRTLTQKAKIPKYSDICQVLYFLCSL